MPSFTTLDAVAAAAPRDLGTTEWVTVTADDVAKFAEATHAHEWIHVDAERARRESPFGTTVAHGYLTLSLATKFITELFGAPEEVALPVNYGLDRVRFPAAVPVGSRVRAHGRLIAAERVEVGLQTVVCLTYECDVTDKPPCVAEVVSLLLPTNPAS